MFQTASLKLGLEQAVMDGVNKNSSKKQSRAELAKLLKQGAYHAITQKDAGADDGGTESFMQASIEEILEGQCNRRSY